MGEETQVVTHPTNILWLLSAEERNTLGTKDQVRRACQRIGVDFDALSELEQEQTYSRLGLYQLHCAMGHCQRRGWAVVTDDMEVWYCWQHSKEEPN